MTATEKNAHSRGASTRKRLTLDLDPVLHLRIKIAAAKSNLSMREYLEEILRASVPAVSNDIASEHRPIIPEAVDLLRRTRQEASAGRVLPDSTEIVRRMRDEQADDGDK